MSPLALPITRIHGSVLQNTSCWIGAWVVAEGIVVMRRIFLAMTGGGGARGGWPCLWLSVAGPLIYGNQRAARTYATVYSVLFICVLTRTGTGAQPIVR